MSTELIVHLTLGEKIDKWTVDKLLGEGTFGAVYKVKNPGGEEFALKTEHISMKLLALELRIMQKLSDIDSKYCTTLVDKGRKDNFTYIVMKLVGQSLQDAKKSGPMNHLSPGCALSVSIQCLEGLKELHSVGYLHRDIKPGNYAMGREDTNELRRIYLLDFGMCKPFKKEGQGAIPSGKFRGTPRYAPLATHRLQEHSRASDLESWFYMLVDFCNASLPWKVTTDLKEIGKIKEESRRELGLEALMHGVPIEMEKVLESIDGLGFYQEPDYSSIEQTIRETMATHKHREFPYDWEVRKEERREARSMMFSTLKTAAISDGEKTATSLMTDPMEKGKGKAKKSSKKANKDKKTKSTMKTAVVASPKSEMPKGKRKTCE